MENTSAATTMETPSPIIQPSLPPAPTQKTAFNPTPSPSDFLRGSPTPTIFFTAIPDSPVPTPLFIDAPIPEGLQVVYITQDSLFLWGEGQTRELVALPNISDPSMSDDGQWIIFRQRQADDDPPCCAVAVWAVRSDGSDLHLLLGPDDLAAFAGEDELLYLSEITWIPGRDELLFSTDQVVEGPPGSRATRDLYHLDLAGQVTLLVQAGQGGLYFVPSPTGRYVAMPTSDQIRRLDLESGELRTLLEFEPLNTGTDIPSRPPIVWDPEGRFLMTWTQPTPTYRIDASEKPVQLWRLFMAGATEQVYRREAFQPHTFNLSPDLRYLLVLDRGCVDGMGMLNIRDLTTGEEQHRYCVWRLPRWVADSEHFIFWTEGLWQAGNVLDATTQSLDFINLHADPELIRAHQMTWVNDTYFVLTLRSREWCRLFVATLEGVVVEIAATQPDLCPSTDFRLP